MNNPEFTFGGFTVPAGCKRIYITAQLEPSNGDPRIQPTGFPDVGPVCYPDPKRGDRSFCLDLEGDRVVALHVVPPGGNADCLVRWDRAAKRYQDCHGAAVDPATLARFPVLTKEIAGKVSVFVDVRTVTPPPAR